MQKNLPGFTFLELLFVMGILAALMFAVGSQINSYLKRSNISTARAGLRRIAGAIDFYYTDTDKYPTTLNDLLVRPADVKGWTEGYLDNKKELIDPWKNKYQYTLTPDAEHPYELFSYGAAGKKNAKADRISVWDAK